jgi:hypothetical protein
MFTLITLCFSPGLSWQVLVLLVRMRILFAVLVRGVCLCRWSYFVCGSWLCRWTAFFVISYCSSLSFDLVLFVTLLVLWPYFVFLTFLFVFWSCICCCPWTLSLPCDFVVVHLLCFYSFDAGILVRSWLFCCRIALLVFCWHWFGGVTFLGLCLEFSIPVCILFPVTLLRVELFVFSVFVGGGFVVHDCACSFWMSWFCALNLHIDSGRTLLLVAVEFEWLHLAEKFLFSVNFRKIVCLWAYACL